MTMSPGMRLAGDAPCRDAPCLGCALPGDGRQWAEGRESLMENRADSHFRLVMRSQVLSEDEGGHAFWRIEESEVPWSPMKTAVIVCDVWDSHWSRGAVERVTAMVPSMDRMVRSARSMGMTIIHAPSDTMDFYEGMPARRRILEAPYSEMPDKANHVDPELPIDDSDGGSDTGEIHPHKAWSRQHPALHMNRKMM